MGELVTILHLAESAMPCMSDGGLLNFVHHGGDAVMEAIDNSGTLNSPLNLLYFY